MKKPRKKSRKIDPEIAYYLKAHGPRKTHERPAKAIFLRLNSRRRLYYASHFAAAGYPMAVMGDLRNWREMHLWCTKLFRDSRGRTYTWTGEKFWFQTEADRQAFVDRWGNQG